MSSECIIVYKIQDEMLAIGINPITDESKNPTLEYELQQKLSTHLVSCTHPQCQKSFKARCDVGLQTIDGKYLREAKN